VELIPHEQQRRWLVWHFEFRGHPPRLNRLTTILAELHDISAPRKELIDTPWSSLLQGAMNPGVPKIRA
jgi:acetyltransferase-like isoleucine patch superfamily enzyme